MRPFEKIEAWQLCHELALAVYRATESFPPVERYGLTSQARRAAFSAAANIAEGCAKRGPREFRRFLDISLGSLSELAYNLIFCRDLGHLSEDSWEHLDNQLTAASKRTWGLDAWISRRCREK